MWELPSGKRVEGNVARGHVRTRAELAAYYDGTLRPARMRRVVAHVAVCATCQAELARMAQMDALLQATPAPRAPAAVRVGLAQRLAVGTIPHPHPPTVRKDRIAMATNTPRRPGSSAQPRYVVASIITVLVIMLAFAVFHARVPGNAGPGARATASANPTVGALDGVAYLGSDHHVHRVTAAGHDTTGPLLPQTAMIDATQGPQFSLVTGTSADGRYIGYIAANQSSGPGGVEIYDSVTQKLTHIAAHATTFYFAPAGTSFVTNVTDAAQYPATGTALTIGDAATGHAKNIEITYHGSTVTEDRLLGWSDPSHVLVLAEVPPSFTAAAALNVPLVAHVPSAAPTSGGPQSLLLAKVDVSNGQFSVITSLATPYPIEPFLVGDGQAVWLAPTYWTATSSVIDVATGKARELPTIAQAFAGKLRHLLNLGGTQSGNWADHFTAIPGTQRLMVSLSGQSQPDEANNPTQQDAGVWAVDIAQDQATQLEHGHYPLSYAPHVGGVFVCDVPAFQPLMINSGLATGSTLGFFTPAATVGKTTTLATTMIAYFGLVAVPKV